MELQQLSTKELNELRSTLHYKAVVLEKKNLRFRNKLERAAHRHGVLKAAGAALKTLESQAAEVLGILQQAAASPALVTAQQSLVEKYRRQWELLNAGTLQLPNATELKVMEMKLKEMEFRRRSYLERVREIDALSNG